MYVQLKEWGNSQGIRLSKEIISLADISPYDQLEVEVNKGEIILRKKNKRLSLEERALKYGGKIEASEEIEYGPALGREKL